MLGTLFQAILLASIWGALLSIFLLSIKFMTKKHFSSRWHYYIWIAVLVVMMLPIRFRLPEITMSPEMQKAMIKLEHNLKESIEEVYAVSPKLEVRNDEYGRRIYSLELFMKRLREIETQDRVEKIAPLWFSVAVMTLLVKLVEYMLFLRKIRKSTRRVACPGLSQFTKRKVLVRSGAWVASPQLLGVFRPVLLLPDTEMSGKQLNNVLAHEMTHLKRNDVLLKWFVVIVKCVHWFNPMIYVIGKQMDQECEISCDMSVTEHMSKEERMGYVDTILAFLQKPEEKEISLTMGMSGSRNQLKKRFLCIKNRLMISRKLHVMARVAAMIFFVGAALTSGEMMCNLFPYVGELNYMSECEYCEEQVIFYKKDLSQKLTWVKKTILPSFTEVDDLRMLTDTDGYLIQQFYDMYFKCPECKRQWTEQRAVEKTREVDVYSVRVDRYGFILQ